MSRSLQCRTHGPSQYKNGQANHHNHHNRFSLNEWQVKKDERGQTMGGKNQKKKIDNRLIQSVKKIKDVRV